MAHVADHLSIVELEERYRSCTDACSARHFQTIWLLAQGHTIEEAVARRRKHAVGDRRPWSCGTSEGLRGFRPRLKCGSSEAQRFRATSILIEDKASGTAACIAFKDG
jgi:hypothetical protein